MTERTGRLAAADEGDGDEGGGAGDDPLGGDVVGRVANETFFLLGKAERESLRQERRIKTGGDGALAARGRPLRGGSAAWASAGAWQALRR